MDLIPELRTEFDQLINSMHRQLDFHAESLFQLFVSKLNKSSNNGIVHESRQPQVRPESNSPAIPDVTLFQPDHCAQSEQLTGHLAPQPRVEQFLSVHFDNVTTDNLEQHRGMK